MSHCHQTAYLHAVILGLRQHLRLALPSAQPRAHNLLLTHHLARAARTCRATFSHKNTFFTRSAQIPISLIWRASTALSCSSPPASNLSTGIQGQQPGGPPAALLLLLLLLLLLVLLLLLCSSSSGSEAGKSELEETSPHRALTCLHYYYTPVNDLPHPPPNTSQKPPQFTSVYLPKLPNAQLSKSTILFGKMAT